MLTNENFERSVNLCNKRAALINLVYKANYDINHPPLSDSDFKKSFYRNNKKGSVGVYIFTALFIPFLISITYWILEITAGEKNAGKFAMSVIKGIFGDEENFLIGAFFLFLIILPTFAVIAHKIVHRLRLSAKLRPLLEQNRINREKYYAETKSALIEVRDELNTQIVAVTDELKSFSGIPEENWSIANELWYLYKTHQADNYKEAIYLWNDIQFKQQQTELARQAAEYAEESREYAYNAMISSQEAAEASRASLVLDAYNTYQLYEIRNGS